MNDHISIRRVPADEADLCIEPLADILQDCVQGGASVSFMLPLPRQVAVDFWLGVVQSVKRGERALLVAQGDSGHIVGTVQVILSQPPNQPHRADVAKMLVHRSARRQGIAQRLMQAVDEVARQEAKTLMVLDTVTGGDAERLYQRSGWTQVGIIPNYALMPDGALCSTTYFYKQLG